ncbi:hypothetical protein [Ensifer adhaerens]|uniref:hypothetical protein n=1 Tax=Ensifer adhaerens TaxID=106592 RepID=UPI0011786D38|nr:hypothetical protein [Ensifer adhaerens]
MISDFAARQRPGSLSCADFLVLGLQEAIALGERCDDILDEFCVPSLLCIALDTFHVQRTNVLLAVDEGDARQELPADNPNLNPAIAFRNDLALVAPVILGFGASCLGRLTISSSMYGIPFSPEHETRHTL